MAPGIGTSPSAAWAPSPARWPTRPRGAGAELRVDTPVTRIEAADSGVDGARRRRTGLGGPPRAGQRRPRDPGRAAGRPGARPGARRARSSSSTCCWRACPGCATPPSRRRRRSPAPSTSTRATRSSSARYAQAAAGEIPQLPPCEAYCHSLTDPTILSPELQDAGVQTLTVFGLHMPARLFRADHDAARERGGGGHPGLDRRRPGRADRGLPAPHARRRAVPGGAHAGRARGRAGHARRTHLPPRPGVAVRRGSTPTSAPGASRPRDPASGCAGRARGGAAR